MLTMKASNDVRLLQTLGFVLGSVCTLATVWGLRRESRKRENNENEDVITSKTKEAKRRTTIPPDLRQEQLSRHTLYFGPRGMDRLKRARVCVVGLGGVGSHCAVSLGRSGVGHLRLLDAGRVSLSSLNRHAVADLANATGNSTKVGCVKKYLEKICPDPSHLRVEAVPEMFAAMGPSAVQGANWNVIIDCIGDDNIPTKAALIAYCLEHKIRVLSCLSPSAKADPTRMYFSDLRSASGDPLASKLRQAIKKIIMAKKENAAADNNYEQDNNDDNDSYLDDMSRLAVLFSAERPVPAKEFTNSAYQQKCNAGGIGGIPIQPALGTMPAIMGQGLAALALTEMATTTDGAEGSSTTILPIPRERVGRSVRHRMRQQLKKREDRITQQVLQKIEDPEERALVAARANATNGCLVDDIWIGPVQVDRDDMEYLLEVWRNRCAVSGHRVGAVLELVRWDMKRPGTCDNLVLLSSSKAIPEFDRPGGKDQIPLLVRRQIEQRLASCSIIPLTRN